MYDIITIEREFASGGNDIGRRLAAALGYRLYDRNILVEASKKLGLSPMYVENLEETGFGGVLFNLSRTPLGGSGKDGSRQSMAEKLFLEEKRIIETIASEGKAVIIGRAAGYILKEKDDCLRVFIRADKKLRKQRAVEREGIAEAEAEAAIKKHDKRRSDFYNAVTEWEWGNSKNFEICLDSGKLGADTCVSILAAAAK